MPDSIDENTLIQSLSSAGVVIRQGNSGAILSLDFRLLEKPVAELEWNELTRFAKLRELFLDRCPFGDEQIEIVCQLQRLQTLSLMETQVTQAGIEKLHILSKLTLLQISAGRVSEQFLTDFRKRMIATRIVVQ